MLIRSVWSMAVRSTRSRSIPAGGTSAPIPPFCNLTWQAACACWCTCTVRAPGPDGAEAMGEGDATEIVGPKAALQVGRAPFVLVGDETSFATAINFRARPDVHAVVETTYPQEAHQVLDALGMRNISVVTKLPNGAHRAELASPGAAPYASPTNIAGDFDRTCTSHSACRPSP